MGSSMDVNCMIDISVLENEYTCLEIGYRDVLKDLFYLYGKRAMECIENL